MPVSKLLRRQLRRDSLNHSLLLLQLLGSKLVWRATMVGSLLLIWNMSWQRNSTREERRWSVEWWETESGRANANWPEVTGKLTGGEHSWNTLTHTHPWTLSAQRGLTSTGALSVKPPCWRKSVPEQQTSALCNRRMHLHINGFSSCSSVLWLDGRHSTSAYNQWRVVVRYICTRIIKHGFFSAWEMSDFYFVVLLKAKWS